ncbi:hypothetical protein GGI17_003554 [Coemansia sp. S146]|nr:hypothetical protein GGI17_003554 [Coemansia sp. S146]
MSTYAGCDERAVDCHTKYGRSHALQGEATSRHYVSGIPATASPRSPLSPLQIQRSGRDLWRETLRSQRHVRRSNSSLSPRHGHQTKLRSRPTKDDSPVRRSLDSQRTEIGRHNCGLGVTESGGDMGNSPYLASAGDGYPRPMWSDEQLRRARRFSSSHTRGVSCPTLNITRIMRSISVSAGYGGGSSGNGSSRFGPRQARRETGLPGSSSTCAFVELPRQQRRHNVQLDEVTLPVLPTIRSCSGEESQAPSSDSLAYASTIGSEVLDHQPLRIRTDVRLAPAPSYCLAEGLRRRISVRQREVGTPDFMAQSEAASPLPLEEEASPQTVISNPSEPPRYHQHHEPGSAPHQFVSLPSLSPPPSSGPSTSSSARWSTISAESPHKRYSYSSSAIAEALRNLQSVGKGDFFGDSDSNSVGKGSGDESMTITLKAPRNLGDDGSETADSASGNGSRGDSLGGSLLMGNLATVQERPDSINMDSFVLSDPPSLRPSSESTEVAIPAVYLDGSASLWDQYVAELESSEFDSNIHLKRQRVSQFMRVPWHVEKLLWFGIAICFDALIYVFSILPAKFVRALLQLSVALFFELPIFIEQACMSSYAQVAIGALPEAWAQRLVLIGRRAQQLVGQLSGRLDQGATLGGNVVRWLSPTQLFDFYRGLLLIVTCAILCHMDAAQMYHSIRAQSSLKLYFIFSALDIFDRLLSSFGHDVMDALQSTVTDPRSQRWKSGAAYFALAQVYMLVHTLVLFYQVITLNVAVNAYSDQLLALLISNQFVEIKSNVFKKWEKEMLFQVVCADVVERFQEIVFLFIIILRNLAELAGPALSPSTGAVVPTAQAPVSFDSATPSAFGPLLPSWISIPLLNRILTPVLMVLGTEILIDWIKHAFITKLNWIRPEIYSHYIDILSRDLACSKAGVRARGIPPPAVSAFGGDPLATTVAKDDEKLGAQELHSGANGNDQQQHSMRGSLTVTSPRSSSILVHAALKVFAWAKANIFAESREMPATATDPTPTSTPAKRRRGHQRTQSVTQPQLFVEQSTRVARRLGLSPMPLACLIMLMLMQVLHILASSSSASTSRHQAANGSSGYSQLLSMAAGWSVLDILGWLILGLIAYALIVWTKLAFANRLMHFAWTKYHAFELRTNHNADREPPPVCLKRFDDSTKRLDRDSFMEVGKLIGKERSEVEWEKQRPKWTLDNIERYSLFKSRIP